MTHPPIPHQRLRNQYIAAQTLQTPAEVVEYMGAMQAQDYEGAKWGVALRTQGHITDTDLDTAFNAGLILRTHVLRPTWHFVTPADIRWMLALTATRVHAVNAYMYRKLEMDNELFAHGSEVIANALQGGKALTRTELAAALADTGILADGFRLSYLMMHAELEGIICSGGRRGKQFTYALLEERAPDAKTLPRDEALAELTRRYFTSHGPVLVQDFAWWSGLTMADAKKGIDISRADLKETIIDGNSYWGAPSHFAPLPPTVYLLPPYDEYGIAYKDHRFTMDAAHLEQARTAIYGGTIVIDGVIVGYWRRTVSKNTVSILLEPFRLLTDDEHHAIIVAAQSFGDFLGKRVVIEK